MKTEKQQSVAAAAFAKKWEGRGYEKGESQIFWTGDGRGRPVTVYPV